MHIGFSDTHRRPCVIIEPGENPNLEELQRLAVQNNALLYDGVHDNVIVDDQSQPSAGPQLYSMEALGARQAAGCDTWHQANPRAA